MCVYACVCVRVDALCRSLKNPKSSLRRCGAIIRSNSLSGRAAVSHGRAPHPGDGRCGGFGQPARLDPGTSDPEEVVQSGVNTVQALLGSLVWDWKMLPGMSAF